MFPQTIQGGNLSAMNPGNKQVTFGDLKVREQCLCPFGCKRENCNEQGYCKHLIGWTDLSRRLRDEKTGEDIVLFEPRLKRYIEVLDPRTKEFKIKWTGQYYVDGDRPEPVLPGDKLVKITSNHRVYRKNPPQREPAVAEERALDCDER